MEQSKLKELLNSMSRKEKIGQLFQIMGHMLSDDAVLTGPLKDLGLSDEDLALCGTILGLGSSGGAQLKAIQEKYMESHPHHIPLIFMVDVIHGYKTIYPMPLAMGATFSPELLKECSKMSAREAAAAGLHVTFSPMVDLVRDARWGRVVESTGEDVYLNKVMAESTVQGYQGDDLKAEDTLAACVKHFAGYGGAEAGRDYNTVELSEHTLEEYYMPAYKAAIDAGAAMVMTSFNTIDGIPTTVNKRLMRDVLRDQMGFKGVLISDFAAIREAVMHGVCADHRESAEMALKAGCDIDMMAGDYSRHLSELIDEGRVSEELLDESVMRILQLKNDLGLFENPFKGLDLVKEKELCLCDEHKELAKKAARESFVLLKNEGSLPVKKGKKIACIGPYTDRKKLLSSWAIMGDEGPVETVKEVGERLDGYQLSFHEGCQILPEGTKMPGFVQLEEIDYNADRTRAMEEDALKAAKEADEVLLFMGEHFLQSGEAASRTDITIPKNQVRLLEKICELNDNVSLVLFTGRPLALTDICDKVKSILVVWMPGTMGAAAIWDVLTGKYAPSGKLPMSFPYNVGQVPIHYDILQTGRPLTPEDAGERFVSKYLDAPNEALYPFGHGLTYTDFSISPITLSSDKLSGDGEITAEVVVKNLGSAKGTETLQLYIHDIAASVARPIKQLKDFKKITLEAGEEGKVSFRITEPMLRFVRADYTVGSEKGHFNLFIGNSSATENKASFELI